MLVVELGDDGAGLLAALDTAGVAVVDDGSLEVEVFSDGAVAPLSDFSDEAPASPFTSLAFSARSAFPPSDFGADPFSPFG